MATKPVLQVLVSLAMLLFAAKLLAKLMQRMGQSAILGEIIAGIIIGPFAPDSLCCSSMGNR
ncbi:MAG: hypothetical protein AB1351_04040 [Thermoproteota archaeon]